MEIIKTNLNFKSLTKRSKTALGILHHTACSTATPEDIHRWHLANGWAGAGYNLYIRKDGIIYELRPINCVGAHATNYNSISVGICFEGKFENEQMTTAQVESGKWIVNYLRNKYPGITFKRHKDVGSTDCPGKNFKFDIIVNGQPSKVISQPQSKNTSEDSIATIQSTLNNRYGLNIAVDNIFGNETKKALTIALQTELNTQFSKGLAVDGIFGNNTYNACVTVRRGAKGNITWILQALLICNGYNIELDGDFGTNTENAVRQYQSAYGLVVDGIAGRNTFRSLLS